VANPGLFKEADQDGRYAADNREFEAGEPHRSRENGSRWQGFGWPACSVGRWLIERCHNLARL
jgi:hypothetical protein